MKELFNDFMLIEQLPGGQERIRIPARQVEKEGLHAGDVVTLIEYDNLRATVRMQYDEGHWYGIVLGKIEDISVDAHPLALAAEEEAPRSVV